MAIAIIKYALISAIVMASVNCVDCQFLTRVIGVNDIITLLENITTCTSRPNADTQTHIEDTLGRVATTQTQMATTQSQMASTQTQMAGAFSQVVSLLETQSQQLQNMTAAMNIMIAKMTAQNTFISQLPIVRDCSDLGSIGSGTHTIKPDDELGHISVYCDMDTSNGGWTVFQRRFDGSVDFFLGWDVYEDGFGNPDAEHWLGLRTLHRLTRQGSWTLRVDLEDFQGNTAYAAYDSFSVGAAASFYRLSIGAYSGTAGDSLAHHNNQMFSTKDSDHDGNRGNCAQGSRGAWWYNNCNDSNLNGLYLGDSQDSARGMTWHHWKNSFEVLKRAEMKIRRVG